jgi:hypothetical protein
MMLPSGVGPSRPFLRALDRMDRAGPDRDPKHSAPVRVGCFGAVDEARDDEIPGKGPPALTRSKRSRMPRFFFDIEVLGNVKPDTCGRELLNSDVAIAEARAYAALLARRDVTFGDGASFGSVLVRSEDAIIHRERLIDAERG